MSSSEIWKPIIGYEDYYEVSNLGRIRAIDRTITDKNGREKKLHGHMMLQQKHRNGYYSVMLTRGGKQKRFSVHRLVGTAFVPNPDNLPEINHKDETRDNNCADNLEWCDRSYNNVYGAKLTNQIKRQSKPVKQMLNGITIAVYPSAMAACRATGVSQGGISGCCRGELKSSGGYQWALA